uniref:Uncharacterized protein n=1 Tax=Podoviridae sp. ctZkC8 TaxID=2825259 RepID=A0A8S5UBV8_9CAUD|nr:MAG TPA: hypothetical protein [Podoviridae sp. ctZkC8]
MNLLTLHSLSFQNIYIYMDKTIYLLYHMIL